MPKGWSGHRTIQGKSTQLPNFARWWKIKINAKMQHTCSFARTRRRAGVIGYKLQVLQTILKERLPEISQRSCNAHNGVLENQWLLHTFVPPYGETDFYMLKGLVRHTTRSHFIQNSAKFCSDKFPLLLLMCPFTAASTTLAVILKWFHWFPEKQHAYTKSLGISVET